MQKLHFSIQINAKKEKVWDVMLGDATYREWSRSYYIAGSYYVGDWSEGSKMLFMSTHYTGPEESGWISRINENRKYEFISIEHIGSVSDGKEDTTSEDVKLYLPSYENYTFVDKDGGTEVLIDIEIPDDKIMHDLSLLDGYKNGLEEKWPKVLKAIKELSERV